MVMGTLLFAQPLRIYLNDEPCINCDKVNVSEVIYARKSAESYIGYVFKGILNNEVRAELGLSLTDEVQAFFKRHADPRLSDTQLLIQVQRLEIGEKILMSKEYAFAYLNLDFVEKVGDRYFVRFRSANSILRSTFEATGSHKQNIAAAIDAAIADYLKVKANNQLVMEPIEADQLGAYTLEDIQLPIQITDY